MFFYVQFHCTGLCNDKTWLFYSKIIICWLAFNTLEHEDLMYFFFFFVQLSVHTWWEHLDWILPIKRGVPDWKLQTCVCTHGGHVHSVYDFWMCRGIKLNKKKSQFSHLLFQHQFAHTKEEQIKVLFLAVCVESYFRIKYSYFKTTLQQ